MEWIIALLVLIADQLSKLYTAQVLSKGALVLIPGVLELTYLKNTGAAWGMFQGARIPFILLTVAFLVLCLWFYKKKRVVLTKLSRIILLLIFSGALGNLIDRVVLGYVRDMIYFSLINFPVFNVADSAIVIGAILLVLETLFTKNGLLDVLEKTLDKKKVDKSAKKEEASHPQQEPQEESTVESSEEFHVS